MIDAVLGHHMNPQTCGVAKFNHRLAERLGVPCLPLHVNYHHSSIKHALVSVKGSEMDLSGSWHGVPSYDLLLHDSWNVDVDIFFKHRRHTYYAEQIGCPSTIQGNPTRGKYRVLVFGMAHKLNLPHFEALKEHLDREHPDYTIELSTAVHEGNPWDDALRTSVDAMRQIFGAHLRVLGFLGDDALARALQDVDAVAVYFVPALRANNTTYWAAVEAGKTIYTNRDEHSPKETDPPASWDRLVELIRA